MIKRLFLAVILVLTLLPHSGFARNTELKNLPIVVEARQLIYDKNKHTAIYIGSVIVQHDKITITGDKLIIHFDRTGKVIEKVEMIGNVTLKSEQGNGKCDRLEYFPAQEKIVLIGNATLKKGKNVIIGDRIVAFKDGNVIVEGIKQKVKTIIFPGETVNATVK
ncbi:lipopolysaccharide transport periplasmic protein LptA [Desulfurobacterium sp.]|uniref:lipopolysaccharide transport periplasmic protein LptA n=1 Tax=Desulfurobacterium sp. TaxID=2004706 RepID=UPI0026266F1D|nr:lipopolysaccharide transport periplasmic protein LptA [Desulfurobacterium sp.]